MNYWMFSLSHCVITWFTSYEILTFHDLKNESRASLSYKNFMMIKNWREEYYDDLNAESV